MSVIIQRLYKISRKRAGWIRSRYNQDCSELEGVIRCHPDVWWVMWTSPDVPGSAPGICFGNRLHFTKRLHLPIEMTACRYTSSALGNNLQSGVLLLCANVHRLSWGFPGAQERTSRSWLFSTASVLWLHQYVLWEDRGRDEIKPAGHLLPVDPKTFDHGAKYSIATITTGSHAAVLYYFWFGLSALVAQQALACSEGVAIRRLRLSAACTEATGVTLRCLKPLATK